MELPDLKLGEKKKITPNEYMDFKDYFMDRAIELTIMYKQYGWKKINENYFFHCSSIPCLYSPISIERKNPKTGRILKQRQLPIGYKSISDNLINHFSPVGCPGLIPFHSVVWCLTRETLNDCYISYHRVGECPFKKEAE